MKRNYRGYSEEFKREVIEYSMSTTKSIKQVCKEFNISSSQFYSWKNKILGGAENARAVGEGMNETSKEPSAIEMADEIRRLRKELEKSQRREEILKKAALILGNDPHNNMS